MSKPDEMMKSQCVKDMLQNVDNSVENALRFAFNHGYKEAKVEGAKDLFCDKNGCIVIDIKEGHGRFGIGKANGKHMFVISTSEKYLEPGTDIYGIDDETEEPLLALVIRDADHARLLANSFERMAKYLEDQDNVEDSEDNEDECNTDRPGITRKELNDLRCSLFDMLDKLNDIVRDYEKDDEDGE